MRKAVLELENVSVHFGGIKAVQDLSLCLLENEILALIGPNGAGKTTAFNVITGVYEATLGVAKAFGQNLRGLQVHEVTELGLARTFQNIRLFKDLTVLDNIMIAMDHDPSRPHFGVTPSVFRARAAMEAEAFQEGRAEPVCTAQFEFALVA